MRKKIYKSSFFIKNDNSKVPSTLFILFIKKLFSILNAGISIVDAIQMLILMPLHPALNRFLIQCRIDLQQGLSLSHSFKKFPHLFDNFFCSIVRIGEQSGNLSYSFERLIEYRQKTHQLKTKIKKIISYPLIILFVSCMITLSLFIFVVPTFKAIFLQYDAKLPIFTQFIFKISDILISYGVFLIAVSIGLCVLIQFYYKKNLKWRYRFEIIIFKLPIVGLLFHKIILSHILKSLSVTYQSGLPIANGLSLTASSTQNLHYKNALIQIQHDVQNGYHLYIAMQKTYLIPDFFLSLIRAGELSGQLYAMLENSVALLEEEIDTTITYSMTLLEPLVMIILGSIVGSLVIAMYLPLFKLGSFF